MPITKFHLHTDIIMLGFLEAITKAMSANKINPSLSLYYFNEKTVSVSILVKQ